MGWLVAWKCLVACLFLEESQQPTWPHSRHRRRCTHVSPVFKQSSQPFAPGVTLRISSRCVHCFAIKISFVFWPLRTGRRFARPDVTLPYYWVFASLLPF